MQKIIFLLIVVAFSLQTHAQEKHKKTVEEKAKKKTTEMVTELKLTKEQDAMLYTTHLKAFQSIEKYDTKDHSKKDKKKQKKIVHDLRDKEYKRILTPAQYKQYIANEKADDEEKDKEKDAKKDEKKKVEKLKSQTKIPVKKK